MSGWRSPPIESEEGARRKISGRSYYDQNEALELSIRQNPPADRRMSSRERPGREQADKEASDQAYRRSQGSRQQSEEGTGRKISRRSYYDQYKLPELSIRQNLPADRRMSSREQPGHEQADKEASDQAYRGSQGSGPTRSTSSHGSPYRRDWGMGWRGPSGMDKPVGMPQQAEVGTEGRMPPAIKLELELFTKQRKMDQDGWSERMPDMRPSIRVPDEDELAEDVTDYVQEEIAGRMTDTDKLHYILDTRKTSPQLIPVPLEVKIKEQFKYPEKFAARETPGMTGAVTGFREKMAGLGRRIGRLDLLARHVAAIERQFGSGAASFFQLIRYFLILNVTVSTLVILFLLLPQELGPRPEQTATFHFTDLLSGQGWLENSSLFYGAYQERAGAENPYWPDYSMKDGYFYTIGVSYIIYFLTITVLTTVSYRKTYISNADSFSKKFAGAVFTCWEMSISDKESAEALKAKNVTTFQRLLARQQGGKTKPSYNLLAIRATTSLLTLVVYGGAGYGAYKLVELSQEKDSSISNSPGYITFKSYFMLPLFVQGILLLFSKLFGFLGNFERYTSQETIFVGVLRSVLLSTVMLGAIIVYLVDSQQVVAFNSYDCWETRLGQELYRLTVAYTLGVLLLSLLLETLRSLLHRLMPKWFGSPQFDISIHATSAIYSQTLLWIGLYYSPLLPLVNVILLLASFCIRSFSLRINCRSSPKIWSSPALHTFNLGVAFGSLTLAAIPYIYVMAQVRTSGDCGPFQTTGGDSPLASIELFQKVFLFYPSVAALCCCAAAVACFYTRSFAINRQRYARDMARQLRGAVEELRLIKEEAHKL